MHIVFFKTSIDTYPHIGYMISQQNSSTTYMYMNVEFENENPCLKKKIIDFFDSLADKFKKTNIFFWNKNLNFLNPMMLFAKFDWNWTSGTGEEDKNVKSLQTDGQTDNKRSENLTYSVSFQLRWAEILFFIFWGKCRGLAS